MDSERIEKVYSVFSGFYDLVFGSLFHPSREAAIDLLGIEPGAEVLEVGVGTGLSLPFYPKNCLVTGIDLCESMLVKGRKRVAKLGLSHVSLMKMDAMEMDFKENRFDAVFAAYVISTVPEPPQVVSEMVRVCKPGGRIVFLNHFKNGNPIISGFEKMISPITMRLGFRADLELAAILDGMPLKVEHKEKVQPLNYWKIVQCTNGKGNNGSPSVH